MRRTWNGVKAGLLRSATQRGERDVRPWMSRTLCIVTVTLMCVQAGAQVTPPSGTGSPASAATPPAASATRFPKSDAVLPTGTRENRWGPFEGRVVDAESGDAIAGAAVIVFWKKPVPELGGGHDEFYDARWAVSDTDGRFTVPRRDPPFITWGLSGAFFSCVAPGYFPYEFKPTDVPEHPGFSFLIKTRLQEGFIAIKMKKIIASTRGERLKLISGSTPNLGSIPDGRFTQIANEINAERTRLALRRILVRYGEFE